MQPPTKPTNVGTMSALLGMLIFSGSLPATRVAVADFSPLFLTSARAVIAALLAGGMLLAPRATRPARRDLFPLILVALGVVVGFPLLTALALQSVTAAHSLVFVGLLPLATAAFGVVCDSERPKPLFWLFSGLGAVTVAAFALVSGGGGTLRGDLFMIAAVFLCGLGYAVGATLSRRLGGWQVISWALLLALPVMAGIALLHLPGDWDAVGVPAWIGLGYVSVFSMFVGFIFWYRGLALGGIARASQLQLLQPFLGLAWAALFLHEPITTMMIAAATLVVLCVVGARRFA